MFLLVMSNLPALVRRFGLFKSCFCRQRPFFRLRISSLDFRESILTHNVQSANHVTRFWTLQHVFTPVMSNLPTTSTRISYGCQKSHLTPATFYILCIFFDILSDCLNAVEVFFANTCHLNTEFIINISNDFKRID